MDEATLHRDLESLVRVRNRLVNSPDSALPKILTGLLPRLLERLESNHERMGTTTNIPSPTESQRLLRDKMQVQFTAILSHAIERIRGGQHTIPSGSPWIPAILGMLETRDIQSPLAMTFMLLILQHSMPLHSNYIEDLKYSNLNLSSNNSNNPTTCQPEEIINTLPALSRFVDKLHQRLAICSSNPNETVRETLLLHYRTSSWICLDVVALSWGLPALIDWERDQFDEFEWSTGVNAKEAFLEHGPSRHAHHSNSYMSPNGTVQNYLECTGAFQLWLDLLLFWPSNDDGSHDNPRPRRRIVRTEAEIMIENSTGMTPEGLKRLHHRCKTNSNGGQSWNVRYLRELKLACMEYIVVPPIRKFLSSNRNNHSTNILSLDGGAEGDNLSFLRCLIICILTASSGSMHGKVAIDCVNKVGLLISTSNNNMPAGKATKSCRSQSTTPVDSQGSCSDGSLLLACSLLTLILGDRVAIKALRRHPEGRARVEALLGPLLGREEMTSASTDPNDMETDDTTASNNNTADTPELPLQRAPLPFDVAERAIDFILTRLLPPSVEGEPGLSAVKGGGMVDDDILPVFVDLVVALSKSEGATGSYFAIQLLGGIYSECAFASDNTQQLGLKLVEDHWIRAFRSTCIDIASQVLSHVAEVDAETRITLGEIQQQPGHPTLPGGVPQPFPGRRDLNMIMVRHRTSQKRKQLRAGCALEARRMAYEIVTELASSVGITDAGLKNATVSKQSPILEMPIILLKCAAFEEYTCMRPYVTGALDSLLVVYKEALGSVARRDLETLVASLLPSLLCAVCSDASAARLSAVRWVVDFVQPLDPGVTWHVCSFLSDDIDAFVSDVAKQALTSMKADTVMEDCLPEYKVQLLSFQSEEDRARIRAELESYVAKTAFSLDMPANVCRVLLSDFKFDTSQMIVAYNADRASILAQCGVLGRANQNQVGDHVVAMSSSKLNICGICCDEFAVDDGFELCCNHSFCTSCWKSYLSCFLGDRLTSCTASVSLPCPEQNCAERVVAEDIQVVAPELLSRWNDCVLRSFISNSKSFSICPGPDCCVVAQMLATEEEVAKRGTATAVKCSGCTTKFCFSCGSDPHQPARCTDFADWNRIFGSSQFWVKTNAKPCPNCKIPIEKNNGCHHIHCVCGHDWCWLCLTTLGSHLEPHICNRYEPRQSAENDDERRALFFTDRFKAHDDAEKFAVREVRSFEEKREKLSTEVLWFASDEDLDNMYTAATTLVRARNFLKNSYVAAWAMRKDLEHRDVFESHQANLELFTEKLSQLLLTKVHQMYVEQGARAIHMHFRAMTFSTGSVTKYMDRILSFMSTG